MSVAFSVFTSDPNLLRCELFRLKQVVSLTDRPLNAAGLGSYSQEEVLLQRYPGAAVQQPSLFSSWDKLESEALLYHATMLPLGVSLEENTQPFRYHRWMFCHIGQMDAFASIRTRLIAMLPEHLQRQLSGDTESEVAFALFLKFLRDTGRTDDVLLEPALAAQLLAKTVRLLEQLSVEAGAPKLATLNFIATNGRMLIATRRGPEPLHYLLLEGSARCDRCGIEIFTPDARPLVRAHRRRRSIAIASHLLDPTGWMQIPDGATIAVGRDLSIQRVPI
jgi:predicted glutamine amidotransferase